MENAMAAEGLKLERFIGPQTGHQYEPETRKKLAERLEELLAVGRYPLSNEVHLTTYTLQYPEADWIQILGMQHQWERADIRGVADAPGMATVTTTNVTKLQLRRGDLRYVTIDGTKLRIPELATPAFRREGRGWKLFQPKFPSGAKEPILAGPIDAAFMDSFLFVRPTGKSLNDGLGKWTRDEFVHATKMWRDVFRGDVLVKDDTDLRAADLEKNLILWGDPSSNKLLAKILDRLPLKWTAMKLVFNGQTYDARHHAPILIFPNPLSPAHYIVLNSGIDFRDDAYGSNALQTPKLPDWAIVDLDTPPGPRWPGRIADAGFFDEAWQLPAASRR